VTDKKGDVTPFTGTAISTSSEVTITLPGGTYYFTSISLSGQARINVTGPSTIYVDGGNVSISGQGIVNNGQPRNLLLYSTGASISLSGQAEFSGAIYAPTATVTLTGQENLYGSIICGSNIDSGQAKIHYDMDLMSVTPVFASGRVSSWQELKV
jgi:choice-of-anchor A domain-containing protein